MFLFIAVGLRRISPWVRRGDWFLVQRPVAPFVVAIVVAVAALCRAGGVHGRCREAGSLDGAVQI